MANITTTNFEVIGEKMLAAYLKIDLKLCRKLVDEGKFRFKGDKQFKVFDCKQADEDFAKALETSLLQFN
jgi:hypothetical protein